MTKAIATVVALAFVAALALAPAGAGDREKVYELNTLKVYPRLDLRLREMV